MSSSAGILSQTLQSITNTKISELRKQRESFAAHKSKLLTSVDATTDPEARVRILLASIGGCTPENGKKLEDLNDHKVPGSTANLSLKNIRRILDQSNELRQLLDQRTRKLDYADLYARLLTEWLADTSAATTPPPQASAGDNGEPSEEPFELVAQTKLQQLREMFESYVFTPLDTDAAAITSHLDGLFEVEEAAKALGVLRKEVRGIGRYLTNASKPFDHGVLKWCIKGLLKNDLLTEHKKTLLADFLQNKVVLTEIAVFSTCGSPVSTLGLGATKLNGKYRVMMDEDILQAIFLHYIGLSWSVQMKAALRTIVQTKKSLSFKKQAAYENEYFLAQLPDTVPAGARGGYDEEEDNGTQTTLLKTPLQIRQQLLLPIASELLIHGAQHGEVAVVQSDIQWFYTSLSHSTIFTVLRYFGVPKNWMVFFKKYLETPLKMVYEAEESEVRCRRRDVPIAHTISNFMAEVVLFVLDFAVNQEAQGTMLYRLTDDLWIWGDPRTTNDAWKAIQRSVEVLGLTINKKILGSVHPGEDACPDLPAGDVKWGFLKLDSETGRWLIDQNDVDRHTQRLKRQLNSSKSIFSFIQLWNSCVGRFFQRTFGQPANCFGQEH
ncbi:MAG: hypothetical protein Q9226_008869, partial [Calogaya cf. arnoldii]